MIPELRDLSYESRLLECGLNPGDYKRIPKLIEVFKIMNGYKDIDRNMFFEKKAVEPEDTKQH